VKAGTRTWAKLERRGLAGAAELKGPKWMAGFGRWLRAKNGYGAGSMAGGRKPNRERRRRAALLRAGGLSLAEVGRRLGVSRQGAASLLRPLRGAPAVACARCGAAIVSAGALPRDAGKARCLACLAGQPCVGLWQRLKSFRLAAGLLQTDLAREAGVKDEIIRRCERERSRPRPATRARLARALGVPAAALEPGGPVPRRLPGWK
jgi:transcriptional regulator with XRE-family HTH domain